MKAYSLEAFGHLLSAKQLVSNEIALAELPTLDEVKALASWTSDMLELFERDESYFEVKSDGSKQDRSNGMMYFAYSAAEQSWSDEQMMRALYDLDDRWKKYTERTDRERFLIGIINRARQKYGYGGNDDLDWQKLLTAQVKGESDEKIVYTWGELLDAEFNIDWQLEGLIAQRGFGMLVAQPGVGKTQMAIQLGVTLALGHEKFLDKWVNLGGSKKVLFLSLEMGGPQLALFQKTINAEYPDDLNELSKNFLLSPLGENIALDTKEGQAFLDNLLTEFMPDMLIIDSLQTAVSKELTDEQAIRSLTKYLSAVRNRHNCSMVLIHHNRKTTQDRTSETELSDVYGSQFLNASVDFVIGLAEQDAQTLTVTMLKNRLGPKEEVFEVVRNSNLRFENPGEALARNLESSGPTGGSGRGRALDF